MPLPTKALPQLRVLSPSSKEMLRVVWRLTRGYRLTPWRSPYLRWRIETYWGLHPDRITFAEFWRFTWKQRRELLRYLRWAASMARHQGIEASQPREPGKIR